MRHEPTRRVLAVAEALAHGGPPVSLTELAETTEASRSTLHAVLEEMAASGWAEKVDRRWRAGPALRAMAAMVAADVDIVRAARAPVEDLVDATGIAAVVFETRDGMAEVVDAVGAGMRTASREAVRVGHVVPIRAPFAREIAAHSSIAEQRRWLIDAGGLTAAARDRITTVLPQIARRGWSIERLTPARRELLRMADSLESAGVGALVRERVSELFVELSEIDVTDTELDNAADLAIYSIAAPVVRANGAIVGSVAVVPGRRMTASAVTRAVEAVTQCAQAVSSRVDSHRLPARDALAPAAISHPGYAGRTH